MENELEHMRKDIDKIDEEIAKLFIARMETARRIGDFKAKNGLPIVDEKREKEVMDRSARRVPPHLQAYYLHLQHLMMDMSKDFQKKR